MDMRKYFLLIVLCVTCAARAYSVESTSFKAYYAHQSLSNQKHTGRYADVVVDLPRKGRLLFSREHGYCPYWKPVSGNGKLVNRMVATDYDKEGSAVERNFATNAAIVERSDSSVVVHWRYATDVSGESFTNYKAAYNKVGSPAPFFADYVDEYFTIYVSGKVERVVKQGCYKLDEWENPSNRYYQELQLSERGVKIMAEKRPSVKPVMPVKVIDNLVSDCALKSRALMAFGFDEALIAGRDGTKEQKSGSTCRIEGVKSYWEKGVSGSCLNFDSYSSAVVLPSEQVSLIETGDVTVSAWIAPLEYPFNTAAIVDHLSGDCGYFLGLDRMGRLEFKTADGNRIFTMNSSVVPLYDWTYVVARLDSERQIAEIFINGTLDKSEKILALVDRKGTDLVIGKTASYRQYPLGTERELSRKFQTRMVFSGLIDEVLIFDKALPATDLQAAFDNQKPQTVERLRPYILPDSPYRDAFEASYQKLDYQTAWDGLWRVGKYADLVVSFKDKPWRYVFWRGTRYLPSLVTDYGRSGIWSSDQSPEVYSGQCFEHMSDMLCRFSNIRLIHSSPARILVHWRNASINVEYQWAKANEAGRGVWTDEYWTIYPDGTSIRHQLMHNPDGMKVIEMNQNEILHHPGQLTEELLYDDAVYTGNPAGELKAHRRLEARKAREEMNLLYTNLNASTKQFQIGEVGTRIDIHLYDDLWWNGWNHYPSQLIPSDGTVAFLYDRGGSSCPSTFREVRHKLDDTTTEAMQIYGLTQKQPSELLGLNRYWNFHPEISDVRGSEYIGFVKAERAYYLSRNDVSGLFFKVMASKDSPVVNPAFVIKNFAGDAERLEVLINGVRKTVEKGTETDEDGNVNLVVWMEYESAEETDVEFIF